MVRTSHCQLRTHTQRSQLFLGFSQWSINLRCRALGIYLLKSLDSFRVNPHHKPQPDMSMSVILSRSLAATSLSRRRSGTTRISLITSLPQSRLLRLACFGLPEKRSSSPDERLSVHHKNTAGFLLLDATGTHSSSDVYAGHGILARQYPVVIQAAPFTCWHFGCTIKRHSCVILPELVIARLVTYQVVTPTAYVVSSSSNNDSPYSDVISQSIGCDTLPIDCEMTSEHGLSLLLLLTT